MQTEKLTRDIRESLARLTNTSPDDWFLTYRARYGVETVLTAVTELRGRGEVLTQPFTCTTAINPILSAGHIPVYVDTSPDDLSLDTSKLLASASSRAVIMQHSFGIESALKKARTFSTKHGLLLLEDSAHHLGLIGRGATGEALADVSVHSFGVEKILPTKFGGAVWVNPAMKDHELRTAIVQKLTNLPIISRRTRGKVKRYRLCNRLINHAPKGLSDALQHFFLAIGAYEPSIMPDELNGKNHTSAARPDATILKQMLDGLAVYERTIATRRVAAAIYQENMPKNLTMPKSIPKHDFAPVRFPVLCENNLEATRLFDVLRDEKHYSGKWYMPTIFPGVANPELYNYDQELCPVAEDLSARILNLPTNITAAEAKEILDVLHRETD